MGDPLDIDGVGREGVVTFEASGARVRRQRRHRRHHPGALPHVDRPRGVGASTPWRTSTRSSWPGCNPATSWWGDGTSGLDRRASTRRWPSRARGVACIVASSFARIFYRNSINVGLPIVTCPGAADGAETGDVFRVDVDAGVVENVTKGLTFEASPLPPFMKEILDAGGLMPWVARRMKDGAALAEGHGAGERAAPGGLAARLMPTTHPPASDRRHPRRRHRAGGHRVRR